MLSFFTSLGTLAVGLFAWLRKKRQRETLDFISDAAVRRAEREKERQDAKIDL